MTKLIGILAIVLIIAMIAATVIIFLPSVNKDQQKIAEFAKCLTSKGFKIYGAYWCSVCKKQKELFGESFKELNYIECQLDENTPNPICIDKGIKTFPTWEANGKLYTGGIKSFDALSQLSGCEWKSTN